MLDSWLKDCVSKHKLTINNELLCNIKPRPHKKSTSWSKTSFSEQKGGRFLSYFKH